MQKILSAELVLWSATLHLFDLQIFFITVPQEARKGKSWGGTSMRATKRILWVFTACKQLKNRGTKCAFILVVVRPRVVQRSFHTEFLNSIRFSPLRLFQRRKQTRNSFAFSPGHEYELKLSLSTTKANFSDKNYQIKNSSPAVSDICRLQAPDCRLHTMDLGP